MGGPLETPLGSWVLGSVRPGAIGIITSVAGALNVHIASVLLEAGTPVNSGATKPLLMWSGDNGVGADIFTRVGAFSYSRSCHVDLQGVRNGRRPTIIR